MKVSAALIAILKQEGVRHIFALPGQAIDPLMEQLSEEDDILTVIPAHEAGAAFMADGYSRAGRGFGVAMTISGPGFTNTLTALSTAFTDRIPLLLISGEVSHKWEGRGALQDSTPAGLRTWDMAAPVVSKQLSLNEPRQLFHHLHQLLSFLSSPATRGPVHLTIGSDIQRAETEGRWHGVPESARSPRLIDKAQIEKLADRLARHTRIVILAGSGCVESDAAGELREFAERFTIPVATTLHGKGLLPEEHPLNLGIFGWFGHPPAIAAITEAEPEIVLVLGSRLGMLDTLAWHPAFSRPGRLIIVDINAQHLTAEWPAELAIVSDIKACLQRLNALPAGTAARLDASVSRRSTWLRPLQKKAMHLPVPDNATSLHPAAVINILHSAMPEETMVFTDSGAHAFFAGHYWPSRAPGRFFSAIRYIGPMGWAIPASIGAMFARPGCPCITLTGDGCMLMHGIEIQTAVRYGIPLICVVFNNSALGNPKLRAESYSSKLSAMYSLVQHDWAMFARALGAQGYTVNDEAELTDAIRHARGSGMTAVIDVHIDNWPTPTGAFDQSLAEAIQRPGDKGSPGD